MKKIISIMLALVLVLSFTGCGGDDKGSSDSGDKKAVEEQGKTSDLSNLKDRELLTKVLENHKSLKNYYAEYEISMKEGDTEILMKIAFAEDGDNHYFTVESDVINKTSIIKDGYLYSFAKGVKKGSKYKANENNTVAATMGIDEGIKEIIDDMKELEKSGKDDEFSAEMVKLEGKDAVHIKSTVESENTEIWLSPVTCLPMQISSDSKETEDMGIKLIKEEFNTDLSDYFKIPKNVEFKEM